MFGRESWFSLTPRTFDLRPRTWQGWTWLGVWLCVLIVPYLLLVARHLAPEALVWLLAAWAAMAWEVRRIRQLVGAPLDIREIFVIDAHGARMERQS